MDQHSQGNRYWPQQVNSCSINIIVVNGMTATYDLLGLGST